ncbi:hypothetical protein LTR08_002872 [Meristemomyces frigidus]|nr:hypothetical protein LTR08_002872 [Meristemomyces frigidus]
MSDPIQLEILSTVQSVKVSLERGNDRLDQINDRLDQVNDRLDQTNDRLDETNDRLSTTERRQQHTAAANSSFEPSEPAVSRLLATTELLEAVLLQLPMRDLLLAQGVSKRFEEVIAGSPIQRALFFEPEPVRSCATGKKPVGPKLKPLLMDPSVGRGHDTWRNYHARNKLVITNKDGEIFAIVAVRTAERGCGFKLYGVERAGVYTSDKNRHFPTGSWRRMLLTQPPGPTTLFTYRPRGTNSPWNGPSYFTVAEPKRVGELWEPHCYGSGDAYDGSGRLPCHISDRLPEVNKVPLA